MDVDEKAVRNERLARAAIRVLDDLLHDKTPAFGQYDRRGLSARPGDGSTFASSA